MRRFLILTAVLVLVAVFSPVASADGDPALQYKTEDNQASAWFRDGDRSVSVLVDEAVRPDDAYTSLWVRAAVSSYGDPFVFCNGVVDRSGVNDYYFRNKSAYVDATIPFYCSDGTGPFDVHVTATWDTTGPANISSSTTSGVDDMGYRHIQTLKYSRPEVAGATVEMDFNPFPFPDFSYGELTMRTLHGVYPQPEGLP